MLEPRCRGTSDESYRLRDAVDGSLSLGRSNRSATPTRPEFPYFFTFYADPGRGTVIL
jgi:hypothetical protein